MIRKNPALDLPLAITVMGWHFTGSDAMTWDDDRTHVRCDRNGVLQGTAWLVRTAPHGALYDRSWSAWSPSSSDRDAFDMFLRLGTRIATWNLGVLYRCQVMQDGATFTWDAGRYHETVCVAVAQAYGLGHLLADAGVIGL